MGPPNDPLETPDRAMPALQVRPRRITILAGDRRRAGGRAMVVIGTAAADTNEGVEFRTSDQIGMIGIGLMLGGVIMTAARPRLRVDRGGLWMRNMLGDQFIPWPLVVRVAYPQARPGRRC